MKTVFQTKTTYSRYAVIDQTYNDRPARVLYAGKATPQSGLALDDEPELLFDYIQRFMEIALSTQPRRVLVIGGGAFTLPKALLQRTNVKRVDAVEIDPILPAIAKEYFWLPDDPRLTITVVDGESYIASSKETYDLIILDAFHEFDTPPGLLEEKATRQYARLLSQNGLVAVNFIGHFYGRKSRPTQRTIDAFRTFFKDVDVYLADPDDNPKDEQNLLLIAAKQAIPSLEYLQTRLLSSE